MQPDFYWLNDSSRSFLDSRYLIDDETAEQRIQDIAAHAEHILGIDGFAKRFYHNMARGYYSIASPIWANFGRNRGLPVSCFGTYITDDVGSILQAISEIGTMSAMGGGCSLYAGNLRGRGAKIGQGQGESTGPTSFMEIFDTLTNVIKQGGVRRGHCSPYIDIDHPDFSEFVQIGSDEHPIQSTNHGIIVSDDHMERAMNGDKDAQERHAMLVKARMNHGFPYIVFEGNMERGKPKAYKDAGRTIKASNMCSEIALSSTPEESFVCILSSMNMAQYDEWKDTDAVETLVQFLDAVTTEFVTKCDHLAEPMHTYMQRARRFAYNQRALGIGILGWHTYFQQNNWPIESREAMQANLEVTKTIQQRAHAESARLADRLGEPPFMSGTGYRHATLTAIAPTKSSSFILGQVSQGVEPEESNYYVRSIADRQVLIKNERLQNRLQELGLDTDETWRQIMYDDGSVRNVKGLPDHDKNVFKTFREINQKALIDMAAIRQDHVDQSQSLNMAIDNTYTAKQVSDLYYHAWRQGVKSLYYQKNVNAAQQMMRDECEACHA